MYISANIPEINKGMKEKELKELIQKRHTETFTHELLQHRITSLLSLHKMAPRIKRIKEIFHQHTMCKNHAFEPIYNNILTFHAASVLEVVEIRFP